MEKEAFSRVESEKQKLLSMSEIGIWLDTYEDIFSDFDPRPFSQRAVSIDFLDEIKRASRERASGIAELRFLIPQTMRNNEMESSIKKRLHDHFKKHEIMAEKEKGDIVMNGLLFTAIGMALMVGAVLLRTVESIQLWYDILLTIFEPAGWFMAWTGLDQIFFLSKNKNPDLIFYRKMANAEIEFVAY